MNQQLKNYASISGSCPSNSWDERVLEIKKMLGQGANITVHSQIDGWILFTATRNA